jgi:hypothetical protein
MQDLVPRFFFEAADGVVADLLHGAGAVKDHGNVGVSIFDGFFLFSISLFYNHYPIIP